MALLPWLLLSRLRDEERPTQVAASEAPPGLSVVMAAHDEAEVIGGCLGSVRGIAAEIVVLDAESRDDTARIAAAHGARVVAVANNAMLEVNKNRAMAEAAHEWVLVLDPDERVSPRLARQIEGVLRSGAGGLDGYWMPRRNYILGRWFRAMGMYPGAQLRLVRRGRGSFSETEHHLPMCVDGAVGCLTGDLVHVSDATVAAIAHKRERYAEFAAAQMHARGERLRPLRLVTAPLRAFATQYLLLGGWLEGERGFVYAALSAYGALLRHAKLWELQRPGPR